MRVILPRRHFKQFAALVLLEAFYVISMLLHPLLVFLCIDDGTDEPLVVRIKISFSYKCALVFK